MLSRETLNLNHDSRSELENKKGLLSTALLGAQCGGAALGAGNPVKVCGILKKKKISENILKIIQEAAVA